MIFHQNYETLSVLPDSNLSLFLNALSNRFAVTWIAETDHVLWETMPMAAWNKSSTWHAWQYASLSLPKNLPWNTFAAGQMWVLSRFTTRSSYVFQRHIHLSLVKTWMEHRIPSSVTSIVHKRMVQSLKGPFRQRTLLYVAVLHCWMKTNTCISMAAFTTYGTWIILKYMRSIRPLQYGNNSIVRLRKVTPAVWTGLNSCRLEEVQ
jgi:hypothetical protein